MFFTNKQSLIHHLSESLQLTSIFVYTCVCPDFFPSNEDLSEHLQSSANCNEEMSFSDLFPPEEPGDVICFSETLDNLRYLKDESSCSSCIKHNESYQRHLEKHKKKVLHDVKKDKLPDREFTDQRVTRQMKRSRSSEYEENFGVENSNHNKGSVGSQSLKLKIKLLPDLPKTSEPQATNLPVETSPKKDEKKSKAKTSKVKFNVPEPLVESLGIDVPSGKDLILLNHLYHGQNAFFNGSEIISKSNLKKIYKCSVCNFSEKDRGTFQSHITQHKSCQSYYQCQECGACFAVEPSWKKHLLLMHRIKNPGPEHYCQDLITNQDYDDYDQDFLSEDGDLVIDTGEPTEQDHFKLSQPLDHPSQSQNPECAYNDSDQNYLSHVPTCLACGAQFSSTSKFKEHKCYESEYYSNR